MDPVAADDNFSLDGNIVTKAQSYIRLVLREADTVRAQVNTLCTDSRLHRIEQHRLQICAVDGELWPRIARGAAERLPINKLAEAVEERRLSCLHRHLREQRLESEFAQHLRRVRQQVDADADRLDLGRGLVDAARNVSRVQLERERQPADSRADDDDVRASVQRRALNNATRSMCLPMRTKTTSTASADAVKRAASYGAVALTPASPSKPSAT